MPPAQGGDSTGNWCWRPRLSPCHGAAPLGTPRGKGVTRGGSALSPAGSQGHAQPRSPAQPFLCLPGFNGTTHPGDSDSAAGGGTRHNSGDSGTPSGGALRNTGLKPAPAPQLGSPGVPKAAEHSLAPSRAGGLQDRHQRPPPRGDPGMRHLPSRRRGLPAVSARHDLMEQIFQPRGAFPARGRAAAAASVGAGQGPSATGTQRCQRPPTPG